MKYIEIFKSDSFVEKASLLLLTALISGFLVPYISSEIQRRAARNDAIIQSQTKLLDDVSRTLMTYETLLLDVSWYKTVEGYDEEMHKLAYKKYADRVVDLLTDWRVEAIKARTLSSPEVSDRLTSFQQKMFRLQDGPMINLFREKAAGPQWQELHETNRKMANEAKELISDLAIEMKLTKDNIK